MAFTCPYSGCTPNTPCEVKSCSFNLADIPIANHYRRCFLLYIESLQSSSKQQLKSQSVVDNDFTKIPRHQREEIASFMLNTNGKEIAQAYSEFYTSMFSLIAQDMLVSLRKVQLEPVLYKQCVVCGREDNLWFPKSGTLPDGMGYCSYACFQLKPPPLLALERTLEIDYRELVEKLEFDLLKSRPKFVSNLIHWVFSKTPMT